MALYYSKKTIYLFRGIKSKHNWDYYCLDLNCFNLEKTENKIRSHDVICKNHDYCWVELSEEGNILRYIQEEEATKVSFTIYAGRVLRCSVQLFIIYSMFI